MVKRILKKDAAEEALYSLYRLEARLPALPLDAVAAIGALELLVLRDRRAKLRAKKFRAAIREAA
jgi:hypothetical protein